MNVVPRSTGNTNSGTREWFHFLKCVACFSFYFVEVTTTVGASTAVTSTDSAVFTSTPDVSYTRGRSDYTLHDLEKTSV